MVRRLGPIGCRLVMIGWSLVHKVGSDWLTCSRVVPIGWLRFTVNSSFTDIVTITAFVTVLAVFDQHGRYERVQRRGQMNITARGRARFLTMLVTRSERRIL